MTKLIPTIAQIGIIGLVLLSFGLRLYAFQQTPYVTGWDGYFYLIQVQSLLETGAMHTADMALIYPFLMLCVQLVGDYVLAFKVVSALLTSIFVGLVYCLGWRLSSRWEVGLLLGSWFVFSPHLTYFAAQYPKNLLGLIFFLSLLLALSFFKKASKESTRKQSIVLLFSVLLLNYFGHRMTFVLSIGLLSIWFLFRWVNWKWWIGFFALGVGFIMASSLFSGVLNWSDIERFDGMFTLKPQFAVWSFYQSFSAVNLLSISWTIEIITNVFLLILGSFYVIKLRFFNSKGINRTPNLSLFYASLILMYGLLFPFFKWSLIGFSYRLVLVFFIIMPISIIFITKGFSKKIMLGLSLFLLLSSFYSIQSYQPQKHDAPYSVYEKVTKNTLQKIPKSSIELLIAHNSLAEYFTFTTHIDALPWLPEYVIDSTKLWRLATDIRPNQLQYYLTPQQQQLTHRLTIQYFLIREDVWQVFLMQIQKEGDMELLEELQTWRNPYRIRPSFLLKK